MSKRIVILQALAVSLSDLKLLIQGMDDQTFGQRLLPNTGSMADVLSHMIAVEVQYRRRLQRVLVEERPFLPRILPGPAPGRPALPTELLAQFEAVRLETLAFLRDVAEDGWERTAVHQTLGEVTFHFLVQYLVDHDSQHLNQIVAIQKQLNALPDRQAQPAIVEDGKRET